MKSIKWLLVAPLLLLGCGDSTEHEGHNHHQSGTSTTQGGDVKTDPNAKEATVKLYGGDDMTYSTREIRVKTGQKITLILTHTGKMPKSTMGHNFVLLQRDVAVNDFANEAAKFQKNDFIPEDQSQIIAHTKMLGGGESDTITFDAPSAGVYNYLCSFTGHSAIMRGKFIVE